jgi:CHAD domain-containing protein
VTAPADPTKAIAAKTIASETTATRSVARVGRFFARKLRALDDELKQTIPRVLHASDVEAIHDMRVAIRRIRTLLKLSRAVYGRFHADAMRRAFTDVQRATGDLRDEEVLEETLADLTCMHVPFIAWRARRKIRERRLRRAVSQHIRAGELQRARTMMHGILLFPIKPPRDKNLAKFARRAIEVTRASIERQRDAPVEDVTALHDLRIAYKELRYTAELFSEALPRDIAAMGEPAALFQKRLGEIHDVDMALATVARARALPLVTKNAVTRELRQLRAKKVAKYAQAMMPVPAPSEIDLSKVSAPIT